MGTPVAPVLATLYLGYYEEMRIIPKYKDQLYFNKRYLDDIFLIWNDPLNNGTFLFNKFRATLRSIPGLTWTYEYHPQEANFLDLWIYKHMDKYGTRTHQKALNLYLYPPFQSAHPPGVQKGLIYGLLLKYKKQNTLYADFLNIAREFYRRLLLRGYHSCTLKPIFERILAALQKKTSLKRPRDTERKYFFKIPYDPNGPTRKEIRETFGLNTLSQQLNNSNNGRIIICYKQPRNLGDLLMRTRNGPIASIPASPVQDIRGINPNPKPKENSYQ